MDNLARFGVVVIALAAIYYIAWGLISLFNH